MHLIIFIQFQDGHKFSMLAMDILAIPSNISFWIVVDFTKIYISILTLINLFIVLHRNIQVLMTMPANHHLKIIKSIDWYGESGTIKNSISLIFNTVPLCWISYNLLDAGQQFWCFFELTLSSCSIGDRIAAISSIGIAWGIKGHEFNWRIHFFKFQLRVLAPKLVLPLRTYRNPRPRAPEGYQSSKKYQIWILRYILLKV